MDARRRGQFRDRHRPLCVQRLVEPERIAEVDQGYARRTAEIREHLSDELVQLVVVDHHPLPRQGSSSGRCGYFPNNGPALRIKIVI
jgi:hypothetical protein